MSAPLFTQWKFYPLSSQEDLRKFTDLFPPDPMSWARENARRNYQGGGSVAGYYPTPIGMSPLGRAVAVVFTMELLTLAGRAIPPETLVEAANCFDLHPDDLAH